MALRRQILGSVETLTDLAAAAEQRFRDGEQLLRAARFAGAVYLLGFSAEMWLKLACFRCRGASLSSFVASQLVPARTWMNRAAPTVSPESFHSLLFWAEYLTRYRASLGNAMPGTLAGQLRHHVSNRVFEDWKIDMRYRALMVTEYQARRVYNDVVWVRNAWNMLWR